MENAAKALIIAGGTILAILVLSLFTYISMKMGTSTSRLYSKLEESDIAEFNQQFLNYDGKTDLTIQDVVTLINMSKDGNNSKKIDASIQVSLNGVNWTEKTEADIRSLLER